MTSLDFLYIALGAGFLLLVIFLCVTLVYFIMILKDLTEITNKVKDTAQKVNHYVLQPFNFVKEVMEYAKPFLASFYEKSEHIKRKVGKAASHREREE
jgi:cell shape-determining protein MreC